MRKKRLSKISVTSHISVSPSNDSIVELNNILDKNEFLESELKKKHVFVKKMLQNMNQVVIT
jgi:hypothetical protein